MSINNTSNLKFIVIKSEAGLYISCNNYNFSVATNERFNGGKYEACKTWKRGWILITGATELTSFERLVHGKAVNYRWELIDKNDSKLNIPECLTIDEACEYESYDGDICIGDSCNYYKFRSLYHRLFDKLPDYWEDIDFSVEYRGTISIDYVNNFQDMKIKFIDDIGYHNTTIKELDLSSIVQYDELDEMLTAPIAIHNRPCKLTSPQTYKIIRAYVKENINNTYAIIKSDYDFCFSVKKRIPIKPYVIKNEIKKSNGRSYVRPKFHTRTIDHKEIELFEMTDSHHKYNNYPIIKGFEGDNLQDLANQIKVFLDELITRINEPLVECEHCNGYGHIVNIEKITR